MIYFLIERKYREAVELYSKAIELNECVAAYYGNRSFAYLKLESYGFALADASKALELDSLYVKVRCLLILLNYCAL